GKYDLTAVGDFAVGAFDAVANDVLSVAISVFRRLPPQSEKAIGQQPTPVGDTSYDRERTPRKRAAVLCQVSRHDFDPAALKAVPEWRLVGWGAEAMLEAYASWPLIGKVSPAAKGICSCNDLRYLRKCWEVNHGSAEAWVPSVHGGEGR